ncbi:NUDIX domain-containing protein [Bailinhaonella thermotolerans]|uniref:NUDIX domain-containing protein n=1 Tax=Bailinhaonella thermotolerans TaxID=1070861 RepID=UPI001F5C0123|nr:NUDIX domain-containing protein [Bailinhaonella thermotolerans]
MLIVHRSEGGDPHVLLQRRSWWSHHGGTWGLPGGARDSHETAVQTALREAFEEAGVDPGDIRVEGVYHDDHGGWAFETVIATAPVRLDAKPANSESSALEWIPVGEAAGMKLHPGFAETWPAVSGAIDPVLLVLDAANIVGSRADGWWKDRAGATARLLGQVSAQLEYGLRGLPGGTLERWYPRVTMIVEGAAKGVRPVGDVEVVAAEGSGDDTIVETVRAAKPWERVLVVTADRGLRERCAALGAEVIGPRWLLDQLT